MEGPFFVVGNHSVVHSVGPCKLSPIHYFGADPIDSHCKVMGQDQYPSIRRFRKPPFVEWVIPWLRDESYVYQYD